MELWMPMMKSINKTVGNGTAVLLVFLAAWIFFCRIPSLGLPDEKEAELFSGPDVSYRITCNNGNQRTLINS